MIYILKCLCIVFCLLIIKRTIALPSVIRIGAVFTEEQKDSTTELAFKYAVYRINKDKHILPKTTLIYDIQYVPKDDSFRTSKKEELNSINKLKRKKMEQSEQQNSMEIKEKVSAAILIENVGELQTLFAKFNSFDFRFVKFAFDKAISCGAMSSLSFLLNKLPIHEYIHHIFIHDNVVSMQHLVECDPIFMNNYFANIYPLHMAVRCDSIEMCKYLIGLDSVDINKKKETGATPLQEACELSCIDFVQLFCCQSNIDVNAVDNLNQNAFHYACYRGVDIGVVKHLLHTSVDKNVKDKNGNSAFDIACRCEVRQIVRHLFSVRDKFKINIDYQNAHVAAFKLKCPELFEN